MKRATASFHRTAGFLLINRMKMEFSKILRSQYSLQALDFLFSFPIFVVLFVGFSRRQPPPEIRVHLLFEPDPLRAPV